MRIVVNTRLLLPGKLDGIGWFIHETIPRLALKKPKVEFICLFDRKPHPSLTFPENVRPVLLPPPTRHPVLWYLWFDWAVPGILKKTKASLFLSPDGFLSMRSGVPQLAVIHDINFMHRPQDLPVITGSYYRYFFPRFSKIAGRIATVSDYTKRDLIDTFSIQEKKIDVIWNGVNELFSPPSLSESEEFRRKHTEGSPFFIYVGSLHPRKNITGLLKAFENFKLKSPNNLKLLIVGERMFKTSKQDAFLRSMKFQKDVIAIGRLNPEELRLAIGSALALTLVSFFEGFGIPLLEAMKCDTPVICSNLTALPEVAGEAAILVDPESAESICRAMEDISGNPELRASLVEKGRLQSAKFSWDRTAELLWQSIEKTLS